MSVSRNKELCVENKQMIFHLFNFNRLALKYEFFDLIHKLISEATLESRDPTYLLLLI